MRRTKRISLVDGQQTNENSCSNCSMARALACRSDNPNRGVGAFCLFTLHSSLFPFQPETTL